jgi:hypothetical protein
MDRRERSRRIKEGKMEKVKCKQTDYTPIAAKLQWEGYSLEEWRYKNEGMV